MKKRVTHSKKDENLSREQLERLEEIYAELQPIYDEGKDRSGDQINSEHDALRLHADLSRLHARTGDILGEASRCLEGSLRSPEDGARTHL